MNKAVYAPYGVQMASVLTGGPEIGARGARGFVSSLFRLPLTVLDRLYVWQQRMDDGGRPTGDPQQITAGLEMLNVDLSADGTRVSYARGRWVANAWRVPVLEDRPATWDDAEQITFDEAFVEFLDVSPDGRHVVFNSDRSGNQDLWRMPLGGEEASDARNEEEGGDQGVDPPRGLI